MNKVITIHLAGRAFQLEEPGYDALRRYLDAAAAALENNPDKDEIIGDLEAAMAEKCQAYLGAHKEVVVAREVEQMIIEMGPVKTDTSGETANPESAAETNRKNKERDAAAPKKLYQIREGAWLSGVCTGLAAYFGVDVALVRIIFVLLTLLTHGVLILLYILMMVIIPHADTPQARAEAFGTSPITAQDLVNRAKEGYEHFANSDEWRRWRRQMRQDSRQWKRQWRQERRQYRYEYYPRRRSFIGRLIHLVMEIVWLLFIIFCLWLAYYHFASVHQFINLLPQWADQAVAWIKSEWAAHH